MSRMCKCATRNEFTHSRICVKMPPVGLEPATLDPVAQTIAQHTKAVCAKTAPSSFTDSRRTGVLKFWTFRNRQKLKKD